MPPPTRVDPFSVLTFRLEIDGLKAAAFSECSGLSSSVEVIENDVGAIHPLLEPTIRRTAALLGRRGYGARVASIRMASARQVFPPSGEASAFQRKWSFPMS